MANHGRVGVRAGHGKLAVARAGLAALAAALALPAFAAQPTIGACPVFPWNNHWNTRVDHLPLHPSSATWVNSINTTGSPTTGRLRQDWGNVLEDYYGIPYNTVPGSQPLVPITFHPDGWPDESDPGPYPIPPNAEREGGPSVTTGDRHVLVAETTTCYLYELFAATQMNGGASWEAWSSAKFDLASNALRPDGWTSSDAAGLSVFAGLVKYDEVAAGEIGHAIRFTAANIWGRVGTAQMYLWPARHASGTSTDSTRPPMGARFRLKASFDISGYHPQTQVILRALKKYGMILADAGSNWYLSGTSHPSWSDTFFSQIQSIAGSNFEVVDTSYFKVSNDSGEAIPRAAVPTDMNADGRSDILWRNDQSGQVFRMLMNGPTVSSGTQIWTEANLAWKIVADGDFDGNGTTDLLWRNETTGQVYITFIGYNGTASSGAMIWQEPNTAWKILHAPDINGDGRSDIVWWNSSTGQVYVMLMNGGTVIRSGLIWTESNTQWRIVATGDFSGSGKQNQLVWRNVSTGQVFLMTVATPGSGFSASGQIIYTEPATVWSIIAANDFNGDGKSDLLWRNESTGQVFVLLMNGGTPIGGGIAWTEPDLAWKIVAAGDYDSDGKADLLWRNDSTGQVYFMKMNGVTAASGGLIWQEPNIAWKILGPYQYAQ